MIDVTLSGLVPSEVEVDEGQSTSAIRYQYDNHLGSASLELDNTGNIISYEEYHPFGTTSYRSGRTETETSQKRYKYVGKERDEETGLYYYGARYYAAWLCRFVSTDPLKEKYLEWSPYVYCADNPIKFIDPDGRDLVKVIVPSKDGVMSIIVDSKISKKVSELSWDMYNTYGAFVTESYRTDTDQKNKKKCWNIIES